jgi:hypothetical protein
VDEVGKVEEVEEVIGKLAEVVDKWEKVDKSGRGNLIEVVE